MVEGYLVQNIPVMCSCECIRVRLQSTCSENDEVREACAGWRILNSAIHHTFGEHVLVAPGALLYITLLPLSISIKV